MKNLRYVCAAVVLAPVMTLAACDSPAENAVEDQAEAIDESYEAQADAVRENAEDQADALEAQGEEIKDNMEDQADDMDATPQ